MSYLMDLDFPCNSDFAILVCYRASDALVIPFALIGVIMLIIRVKYPKKDSIMFDSLAPRHSHCQYLIASRMKYSCI